MQKTLAIIILGGRGTRVPELTGGVVPKSICFVKGKPLVTYQIEVLVKFGVNNFLFVFEKDWQCALFKNYTDNGLIPSGEDSNFTMIPFDWAASSNPLADLIKIESKVGLYNKYIISHGDVFYSCDDFKKLLISSDKNGKACFFDVERNIYAVPLIMSSEIFFDMTKSERLDFEKTTKDLNFDMHDTATYFNINTIQDLKRFEMYIVGNVLS